MQQVPVPHGARHLLQESSGSLLAEDAAQQIRLQLQHRQLLFEAGAFRQGRLWVTRPPWDTQHSHVGGSSAAGPGALLIRLLLLLLDRKARLCADVRGSKPGTEARAGRSTSRSLKFRVNSDSPVKPPSTIHLVTKAPVLILPSPCLGNLSPLHCHQTAPLDHAAHTCLWPPCWPQDCPSSLQLAPQEPA